MLLGLHRIHVQLSSSSATIRRQWQHLLDGWLADESSTPAQAKLCLEMQQVLPPLPEQNPYFTDSENLPEGAGILEVYKAGHHGAWLHYLDGALVKVPLQVSRTGPAVIEGTITSQAIGHGRFEDITFTSMAPVLRRHGYFMVHAFAAAKNGRCVLIVGPTGSGKTTTGLCMLLHGWRLLSNDLVLLEERGNEIYALPTPGIVNIRPQTLELLPDLRPLLAGKRPAYGRYNVTGEALINGRWADPQPVTEVYFPRIEHRAHTSLHSQNRGVALARLMAESMDRWDEGTLTEHFSVLQRLAQQAVTQEIRLGQQMSQIATLIAG